MNDTQTDIDTMISKYTEVCKTMSALERAKYEVSLFEKWQENGLTKYRSRKIWAQEVLKITGVDFEIRHQLFTAGSWVDPLWKMMDDGISKYPIRSIFRQAKDKISKDRLSHEEALKQAISEYNAVGSMAQNSDGVKYRRKSPGEKFLSDPPPSDQMPKMDMDGSQGTRSKQFMLQIIAITNEFLRTSVLDTSDDISVKIAKEEFISLIRESVEDLRRKILSIRSQSKKDKNQLSRISRSALSRASEVLGLPVIYGMDIDLRKAKKIQLRRCAQLHPDKNGQPMDQKRLDEYMAVIDAFKVFEGYMENRKLTTQRNGENNEKV